VNGSLPMCGGPRLVEPTLRDVRGVFRAVFKERYDEVWSRLLVGAHLGANMDEVTAGRRVLQAAVEDQDPLVAFVGSAHLTRVMSGAGRPSVSVGDRPSGA